MQQNILTMTLGPLQVGFLECDSIVLAYTDEDWSKLLPESELKITHQYKNLLRKAEFLTGRLVIHHLRPGISAILKTDRGVPAWPKDFVGSISHKDGHVVASMESTHRFFSLGIDIEEPVKMPLHIANVICRPEELRLLESEAVLIDKKKMLSLIFSAKEALFKCCYQRCGVWFNFHDAILSQVDQEQGKFTLNLLKDLSPTFFMGQKFDGQFKFVIQGKRQFLLSGVWVFAS